MPKRQGRIRIGRVSGAELHVDEADHVFDLRAGGEILRRLRSRRAARVAQPLLERARAGLQRGELGAVGWDGIM